MARVRRIVVSQIEGGYSNDSDKRPKGEISLYDDDNGGFDLVIHNGVTSTNQNKIFGRGKFYGHNGDSGDNEGNNTIKLIPDIDLYDNGGGNQYIIVDPTGPNHIHLRAGGSIDNSTADLYLGGEINNVRISDYTTNVTISSFSNQWVFGSTGNVTFPDNTVQTTAWSGGRVVEFPTQSIGAGGDLLGDISFTSDYLYYCTSDFDGVSNIWKRISWSNDTW